MENRILEISDLHKSKAENALNRKVCIFGQGFVGLPLALSFALGGCYTVGVDVDDMLVDNTNKGLTYHTEKFHGLTIQEILKTQLKKRRYIATTDAVKAISDCNNIIVTVGIPIKNGKFIMDYLESACRTIGGNLKKGDLVIIRSTVIPGTTEVFVLPILEEESGMKAGIDFYLAYASERIAEGNAFDEFENIQRDVNIAMVQEFARFTEALGIDIFEVIRLANTHKRVNLLVPGPGVGGYCIPNAYYYLAPIAKEFGLSMDLLKLAREKNALIPEFIVNKTEELLNEVGKELKGSKVAVLGLAMKDYSNDDRISPPVDICKLLIERGATVRAFDPMVQKKYEFKTATQDEAISGTDAALVLAKQHGIHFNDVEHMVKKMNKHPVCIDGKATINREEALKYGLKYWRI